MGSSKLTNIFHNFFNIVRKWPQILYNFANISEIFAHSRFFQLYILAVLHTVLTFLFPFKVIQFLTFRLFLFSQKFYLTTFWFILRLSFSFEFFVTLQFVPNTYTDTFSSPNKFYYPIHNTMFTYHSTHKVNMKK